jgi:Family of unknown function (DUF5709)
VSDEDFGDTVYESGVEDAEDLDPIENLTSDDPDEIMQTGYDPPDREPKSLRDGLTDLEQAEGESLDERLAEEEPDVTADDVPFEDPDPRAGRLVAPDEGAHPDEEAEEIATDVGPAGYASSAEEAAVHVVSEDRLFGDEE